MSLLEFLCHLFPIALLLFLSLYTPPAVFCCLRCVSSRLHVLLSPQWPPSLLFMNYQRCRPNKGYFHKETSISFQLQLDRRLKNRGGLAAASKDGRPHSEPFNGALLLSLTKGARGWAFRLEHTEQKWLRREDSVRYNNTSLKGNTVCYLILPSINSSFTSSLSFILSGVCIL